MLLEGKNAVIYGAAGAIGSAVARTFAREGARLFLAGRTLARVKTVADEIGSRAAAAQVDANDEPCRPAASGRGGQAGGDDRHPVQRHRYVPSPIT